MAVISITAANMIPSVGAQRLKRNDGTPTIAFAAFTAGQLAYLTAGGLYGLASATGAAPVCNPVGIFENSGAANQVCSIIYLDPNLVLGGTLVLGKIPIMGVNGAINDTIADAISTWHVAVLGICMSATVLNLQLSPVASAALP
jgi:hypothetical protein